MKQLKSLSAVLGLAVLAPLSVAAANYETNYPADATIDVNDRFLNSIILSSPTDGTQSAAVNQHADGLLFHDVTNVCFAAVPGESVLPSFDWNGGWMHGYVYLDCGNDGTFDWAVDEDGNLTEDIDVMAYSNYNRYNSAGALTDNGNVGVFPPGFVVPDLEPGLYRMRYKIDWNSIDPGGNDANGPIHKQTIIKNRGAIADVLVYLHPAETGVEIESAHGKVYNAKGEDLATAGIVPGQIATIQVVADQGYRVAGIKVESGYNVELPEGVEFALESLNRQSVEIPAELIIDGEADVPAAFTFGNVKITVEFAESDGVDYSYELTGAKDAAEAITGIAFTSADGALSQAQIAATDRHFYFQDAVLHADRTAAIVPTVTYGTGDAAALKLYVDFNHDGIFDAESTEKVSEAAAGAALPAFTVPAGVINGVYRARVEAEGVAAVDFLFNLHNPANVLRVNVMNGNLMGADGASLPATVSYGDGTLVFHPVPTFGDYTAEKVIVRHGHNLDRRQYIRGNRQWDEFEISPNEETAIPASAIDGDILVTAEFLPSEDSEWVPVWSDEFTGNTMDTQKWAYHPRRSSDWNRFIAVGGECEYVNIFEDGQYKSYCMPTPEEFWETDIVDKKPIQMISGAIYTSGKFHCTGGWIEARLKTTRHTGNFPAFWMMPTTAKTWPLAGEIDIFETINNENKAWHTIHTAWANQGGDHSLPKPDQPSPTKGGSEPVTVEDWHVYALEWDQDALKWYVDGELVFTYPNMHYSDSTYDEFLAWPFSAPFYIICNQSVGKGSWAAQPDTEFTYHTEFDYVRVYQKKDALNYYSTADGQVSAIDDVVVAQPEFDPNAPVEYYNLQGVRVDGSNLAPGFYIRRQSTQVTKVAIR